MEWGAVVSFTYPIFFVESQYASQVRTEPHGYVAVQSTGIQLEERSTAADRKLYHQRFIALYRYLSTLFGVYGINEIVYLAVVCRRKQYFTRESQ